MSLESLSPYESLFNSYFSKATQMLQNNDQICELLPLFYVISDLAVIGSHKDRRAFSSHAQEIMLSELSKCAAFLSPSWLNSRADLYASVLRSGRVRAEWFPGDKSILTENQLAICCSVFGDLIWNPACVCDYFYAPFLLVGVNESAQFVDMILRKILPCMANYYKSVYDLPNDAKSLRQCSPDPANLSSSKAQVGAIHVNPVVLQESVHRVPKKHRSTFFAKKVSLYVVLILVLCFAAICLIVARNKYDHGYRNGYDSGYTIGYDNGYKVGTYAPQSSEESSSVASETASEEPTVANEPIPVPEPASGAILSGRRYDSQSEITITADALSSYVVKLKGVGGSDILSFYVRSGDTITVAVPPKQMYVYFASGTTWYGKDSLFGENTFYSKDDELLDFSQYTFSYTLYPVSNGNFSETPIDASEFN